MNFLNFNLPDRGLVLIAGRSGMGKSYIAMEIAKVLKERKYKCVLLMADGKKAYPCASYSAGKTHFYPSELQRAIKICPDISFVVEDGGGALTEYGWETLIKDIVKYQKAKIIFINAI